jgi:hypothetical protein
MTVVVDPTRGDAMKRLVVLVMTLISMTAATAHSAASHPATPPPSHALQFSLTLVERFDVPQAGCLDVAIAFNCGTGSAVPFGQVTEEIAFGLGCSGTCDLRWITFSNGDTIVSNEVAQAPVCLDPDCNTLRIPVQDTIVGGTGRFANTVGVLTGTVTATAANAVITLDGTMTVKS